MPEQPLEEATKPVTANPDLEEEEDDDPEDLIYRLVLYPDENKQVRVWEVGMLWIDPYGRVEAKEGEPPILACVVAAILEFVPEGDEYDLDAGYYEIIGAPMKGSELHAKGAGCRTRIRRSDVERADGLQTMVALQTYMVKYMPSSDPLQG
jgi:hypothetical protein